MGLWVCRPGVAQERCRALRSGTPLVADRVLEWPLPCTYAVMFRQLRSMAPALAISALLLGMGQLVTAQDPQNAPDNTATNKRDRKAAERTADQAKETPSDRAIMQKIRKAIMADKSLSTYGHNVKVIAEHGKVTLKGPVNTEDESKSIEAKATEVAGAGNVANQLAVKGDKAGKN